MKRLIYTLAAGATILAACQPANSYKIDGTTTGFNDGDTIYLQEVNGRDVRTLDSTVVADGKFSFSGTTDTIQKLSICYKTDGRFVEDEFFLEKGTIKATLDKEQSSITGTPNNDIYNQFNAALGEKYKQMRALYETINDSLPEETRKAKTDEMKALQDGCLELALSTIKANVATEAAYSIFNRHYYAFDLAVQEELINAMPEAFQGRKFIVKLKERLEILKNTAVGKQFVDFEMQTPEGESVKLSDFIGKNKVTLVDFWASWCGPCRAEMPNVVEAYKKYQAKGFGVVGVSLDDKVDAWKDAIKNLGITWPQMSDLKGWENEGAKLYGVNGIPATVLVGQDGVIIARDLRGEQIAEKLEEILK